MRGGQLGEVERRDSEVRELYQSVLNGWNEANGDEFAGCFAEDGEVVGFDGSQSSGRKTIAEEMNRIFADHATGRYFGKVRNVRFLNEKAAVLRAVAGVVPAGESDVNKDLNSVQTLVAQQGDRGWRAVLYQSTPAHFHGRPELAEHLTDVLRREVQTSS